MKKNEELNPDMNKLTRDVKEYAVKLGADLVGIAPVSR